VANDIDSSGSANQAQDSLSTDQLPSNASVVEDAALDAILTRFFPGGEVDDGSSESLAGDAASAQADASPAKLSKPSPKPAPAQSPDPAADSAPSEPAVGDGAEETTETAAPEGDITDVPAEGEAPADATQDEAATAALAAKEADLAAQLEALRQEKAELESRLSTQNTRSALPAEQIEPLMCAELPEIEQRQEEIDNFKRWAVDNWNGFENPDPTGKSYTAEEVQQIYRKIDLESTSVIPKALRAAQHRAQVREVAAETYPELFDPKRPEFTVRQNMLKRLPALKAVFPEFELWLGHMFVGQKEWNAKRAKKGAVGMPAAKPGAKAPVAVRSTTLPKPALPSGSASARPVSAPRAPRRSVNEIDAEAVFKSGNSRDALIEEIRRLG
jgi:hypothetical protein